VSAATKDTAGATGGVHVALLERRGKFLVAEPFFDRGPRLVVSRGSKAAAGDLVVVRAGGRDGGRPGRGGGRASVTRRIGRPDVTRDVIEALMVDRGLRRRFDPAVENEAREASADTVGVEAGRDAARRDLRSLPTLTIDPLTARDFDDAISATEESDGAWRVWVHIADVAAYVQPRSLIDREAYRRGTSVYVPGAVEPMLPEALSNGACSLVAGEDRLAVTVEMEIVGDLVRRAAFYRSTIRSDERLDYDRVDRIFAGVERAYDPWAGPLAAARAAAAALGARRAARGALVVGSSEPEFSFDEAGNVVRLEPVVQTESHRLIEHLMISANEQVAQVLDERGVPTLFRVHEPPDAPAVERLIEQLASLDVPTPPLPKGHMTPQQAADIVGQASVLVDGWATERGRGRRALTRLVLRALKQAYYDPRNLGHAGLKSPRYCHFTSPIRRYPDLICHRALLSAVISGKEPAPQRSWVSSAGSWASAREREAMTIERDADDIARAFLLERSLAAGGSIGGETAFDGEVVGLIGAGAFISFGPEGVYEGMLPVRRLEGDWWELNEAGTTLIGTRSGAAIRLGDPVRVQVGRIDAPRGRVDLLPVDE
jgi:ribonuclease R